MEASWLQPIFKALLLLLNLSGAYIARCQRPVPGAELLALQDQLPPLMASKEAGSKHLAQIQHQQSGAQQAVADLKRDTDILINAFLKEEKRVRLCVCLLGAAIGGCKLDQSVLPAEALQMLHGHDASFTWQACCLWVHTGPG